MDGLPSAHISSQIEIVVREAWYDQSNSFFDVFVSVQYHRPHCLYASKIWSAAMTLDLFVSLTPSKSETYV
jgi:hypothetical protein